MLFYVLIVCNVTLPPGVNPIAVDKYIYIYLFVIIIGGILVLFICITRLAPNELF